MLINCIGENKMNSELEKLEKLLNNLYYMIEDGDKENELLFYLDEEIFPHFEIIKSKFNVYDFLERITKDFKESENK